jgi:hypothetical protein
MKKIFMVIAAGILIVSVFAQTPSNMSYQAVIRNSSDQLVINHAIGMKISILQGSVTGTVAYEETHTPTSNANGLITIEIGSGTIVFGDFDTINWANGPYFVKTYIDPSGGTNYTLDIASQLLSVPYAFYAKTAESIAGGGTDVFVHHVGEVYGGGIIFQVFKDTNGIEHGLVVADSPTGEASEWGMTFGWINCESTWNGIANTAAIIADPWILPTDAAYICTNYTGGGYTDWYLPAIQELNLLYNNLYHVNKTLSFIANREFNGVYWSSTAIVGPAPKIPYSFNFLKGYPEMDIPQSIYGVLPIRMY